MTSRRDFLASAAAASLVPWAGSGPAASSARQAGATAGPARRTAEPPAAPRLAAPDRLDPWIEVDPAALAHNVGQIRRLSHRPILAVLKNNAYGLGLAPVARRLEPMDGIAGFAVVRVDEALALRDAGIRKPVLLMARVESDAAAELAARGIELSVTAADDPARLAAALGEAATARVHLYLDTGMSRMGIRWDEALPVARELAAAAPALEVAGTFMAFTEEPDFDLVQLGRFSDFVEEARAAGFRPGTLHAASSNGVFHLPGAHLDAVRPGIAIFGAYPSRPEEERTKAELVPAVRLKAGVARVSRLEPGDSVSYGRSYVADRPVWIATLPVGHSDGYPREAVNGARVRIGGRGYPVIGAVSASHTIIEVGDEPTVRPGDVATLLGPDHPDIHPNALAGAVGVSVYDLLMHLGPLLPRHEV